MTFISENMRTCDPDRGIELILDKTMSDGTMLMRLVKSDATFHFSMQTSFDPPPDASGKSMIVRHVRFPSASLSGFTVEETANLIQEALGSFKGICGKHADEQVRVVFK